MKGVIIFGADEVIKALKAGKILYVKNGITKYWMHDGLICSSDMDDDEATMYINAPIMTNQEFIYYG